MGGRVRRVGELRGDPDLVGLRFSRLVAVQRAPDRGDGRKWWQCHCACGQTAVVESTSLRNGHVQSCGCLRDRGVSKHPMYRGWLAMIHRCHYTFSDSFHKYGARGITVCDRWRASFENFLEDMGPRPKGFTLDRIDGTKGYSLDNCRWADSRTQSRNRRGLVLSPELVAQLKAEHRAGTGPTRLAAKYGINRSTLKAALYGDNSWRDVK